MAAWIVAAIASATALLLLVLLRGETKDRHNLALFVILMFLHPNVNEAQRTNFLRLLKRLPARDSGDLALRAMSALTQHAGNVTGDIRPDLLEQVWLERNGAEYPKL